MKKLFTAAAALSVLLIFTCSAWAHPPKSVTASWNGAQHALTVTAEHSVNDVSKHYILSLTILDGNKQILMKQYSKQDSPEQFTDTVLLKDIKPGTKLRVLVTCNIMGSKETQVTTN